MYDDTRWHARRWIALGFLAIFAVFVGSMIYLMAAYPGGWPMGYGMYPWGFGWMWGLFGLFLFLGFLRWALFPWRWGGYYRHAGYGPYGRENEAYHILRERYARGEVTKDQYDAMMRDLYPPRQGP